VTENAEAPLLVLGAGYLGAVLAGQALDAGRDVVLADNWYATRREQLAGLEARGARVETADIRVRDDVQRLLALEPERIFLLAAQASRLVSERDPDYTEQTNATGVRHVAEAARAPVVFASSLHVYGTGLAGDVRPDTAYGAQGDLAHLSKIYGELVLSLQARRAGFGLALMRLGILYGPSPVEHESPESQTVVDKFRRLAAKGAPLPLDDGGRAAIGVVHVEDAARILLAAEPAGVVAENVAAETVTVADVAALAEGRAPAGNPGVRYRSPFEYRHTIAEYLGR
jgi:nucleoside-diphosphate-sugar epimerase